LFTALDRVAVKLIGGTNDAVRGFSVSSDKKSSSSILQGHEQLIKSPQWKTHRPAFHQLRHPDNEQMALHDDYPISRATANTKSHRMRAAVTPITVTTSKPNAISRSKPSQPRHRRK
jgi:hypothetical protein